MFGLDLNKNVVATVTDGASLMVKFRKETCPEHVTCYAQAIHLAVCDVLYKKTRHNPNKDFTCLVNDCKSDNENDSITKGEDCFEDEERNIAVPLASNLQDVVQKDRKIVKLFRQSPVKNDNHI